MAQNKKTFTAYCDWLETFEALPDAAAGALAKHLFRYVNDQDPQTDDLLITAVFANIKNTLKRDLKKYEEKCNKNKAAAEARWKSPLTETSDRPGEGTLLNDDIIQPPAENKPKVKKIVEEVEELPKVANSPYGDGTLHYMVGEFYKQNPKAYDKKVYEDFLTYWTSFLQKGRQKGVELWRTEMTFNIKARLNTWQSISKKHEKNGKSTQTPAEYLRNTAAELNDVFGQAHAN